MEHQELIPEIIKERFPNQNNKIEQLYEMNESFQSLCFDYLTCLGALRKFQQMSVEHEHSVEEFEILISDLEKELYKFIYA
jgi:hypothetical protein